MSNEFCMKTCLIHGAYANIVGQMAPCPRGSELCYVTGQRLDQDAATIAALTAERDAAVARAEKAEGSAEDAHNDATRVEADNARLRAALTQLMFLVRLKDNIGAAGADRAMLGRYQSEKRIAWDVAVAALSTVTAVAGAVTDECRGDGNTVNDPSATPLVGGCGDGDGYGDGYGGGFGSHVHVSHFTLGQTAAPSAPSMEHRGPECAMHEASAEIDPARLARIVAAAQAPGPVLVKVPNAPQFSLVAHLHRQRAFNLCTFGPGTRHTGILAHIRKELAEIEAAPADLSEWIDVIILACDGAMRMGHAPEQVAAALAAKQAKNEARTWPDWRTVPEGKPIEHDRSGEVKP